MLALWISRVEAALIQFEDRQDQAKEKMDVAEAELTSKKGRIGALVEMANECKERLDNIEEYLHDRWLQEQEALEKD